VRIRVVISVIVSVASQLGCTSGRRPPDEQDLVAAMKSDLRMETLQAHPEAEYRKVVASLP